MNARNKLLGVARSSPLVVLLLAGLAVALPAAGAVQEYDLAIEQREVSIGGRTAPGMTINGGIPGPVLRFVEGETARIRVENRMQEETSIHWHGLLVPPGMDGVPNLSFPPIAPGATFVYEFPLRQSGTYWYHSHSGLQEQRGVYGAIVIEPPGGMQPAVRDVVVLLSDWTSRDPHEVNRMLRRGSEWFALEKGAAQSLVGAARSGHLGDFFQRELQRMPPMDIADVAYDYFLANGRPETTLEAAPGERLRVRVVDGSATTFFHLEFAGGPLQIVAADGQEIEPVFEKRLLIGVAETYDVLLHVPDAGAWELRATAHDGSGHASVWIGSGERHRAPAVPRPNLYAGMGHGLSLGQIFALTPAGAMAMPEGAVEAGRFDKPGMAGMEGMGMHAMATERELEQAVDDFFGEKPAPPPPLPAGQTPPPPWGRRFGRDFGPLAADISSAGDLASDGSEARPWPPYARLRATASTAPPAGRPVREIRLTLDGDMERYVWFLNNRALSESDDILIRSGEVVRFIMINRTMMHHPMHLHGQFFRVINGQGERAPLKHTVNVAPMSTTVIEFAAEEPGDWFFHCHLLYHMMNGMARVVHYEGFDAGPELARLRPRLSHDDWHGWGDLEALSNMAELRLTLASIRTTVALSGEVGWQGVETTQREALITAQRYLNRFWTVFAGGHFEGGGERGDEDPAAGGGAGGAPDDAHAHEGGHAGLFDVTRGVAGLRTLLPLSIELVGWVDTDGGARATLEKSLPLTPRLELAGAVQYDTRELWEGHADVSCTISRGVSLVARWHSAYGFGGGLHLRF